MTLLTCYILDIRTSAHSHWHWHAVTRYLESPLDRFWRPLALPAALPPLVFSLLSALYCSSSFAPNPLPDGRCIRILGLASASMTSSVYYLPRIFDKFSLWQEDGQWILTMTAWHWGARSLSLYSQPLTLSGTALLHWTGLKRNEPAAGVQSSSSYQQLMELSKVHDINRVADSSSLIMHHNIALAIFRVSAENLDVFCGLGSSF